MPTAEQLEWLTPVGRAGLWLQCAVPRPDAQLRLVCFPHAGGSASFFRDWGNHLPGVEVLAVCYPGRTERMDEPAPTDLRRLAHDIAEAVRHLADRPLALFGHSMGAVVALETGRELERRGVQLSHVWASGSRDGSASPPATAEQPEPDADALADMLIRLGGTDPELAHDPEFQELVRPYVLGDDRMFHDYDMALEPRLRCPVTTIVGDADPDADVRPWRTLTEATFREYVVAGDHFYLLSQPPYSVLRRDGGAAR